MKECDPELYHTLNYLKNNNDANLKEDKGKKKKKIQMKK